jgi:HK97 family phage major capsid protein
MSDQEQAVFDEVQLKAALKENHDEVKDLIEKANAEAKEALSVSTETKAAIEAAVEEGKKFDQRLADLEQARSGITEHENLSIGAQFVASDGFKAMQEGRAQATKFEVKTTLTNATINMVQPLVAPEHIGTPYHLPERQLSVWDALPKGRTGSNIIAWPRETYTNNAGPQIGTSSPQAYTEGGTKPESAFSYTQVTRPVQTIAHFLPVSTQFMEDTDGMESYLNNRLVYGLREELEDQALLGTGANGNLSGLVTEATAFAAESPDTTGSRDLDILRSAIRQLQIQNYSPSHFVINPADWYAIDIVKVNAGTDDRYIIGNPAATLAPRVWGLPVIVSNAITAGTFLLGDFNNGAMVFEKSGISFQAAYQDASNFRQNLVTLRAEARLALCVWRTEAFVTGSI